MGTVHIFLVTIHNCQDAFYLLSQHMRVAELGQSPFFLSAIPVNVSMDTISFLLGLNICLSERRVISQFKSHFGNKSLLVFLYGFFE